MTATPTEKTSIGLMLGSVVLFAVNALLIKGISLAVPAADGWVASLFRGAVGMAIVWIAFRKRGFEPRHLCTRPLLIFRGLLGGFGILAFYLTVVHLGAGRAAIINLSYPIFGSLFAAAFLKEVPPLRAWLWMTAGFAGLVIFLGGGLDLTIGGYDLLAVAGAVAAGGVVTLIRQLRHTEHTSTIYASQCAASALFAAGPAAGPSLGLPTGAFLLMTVAGIIVAVAQLAMTHAYRSLSVARGSSLQMLLPLLTAVGGYLCFGETFTSVEIGGAALTLVATWQVITSRSRRVSPESSPAT
ncbi:DMT family transporter [Haloferula helveola]